MPYAGSKFRELLAQQTQSKASSSLVTSTRGEL